MTELAEQLLPEMQTIRGDLRDLMVGAMCQMTKLWRDMPEHEQLQLAQVIDAHAQAVVTRIAVLTATAGRPGMLATLDSVAIGDTARATISMTKEQAGQLAPFTKQIVAVMAVGQQQFMGEREPVRTMPDQNALPMGEPEKPKNITIVAEPAAEPPKPPATAVASSKRDRTPKKTKPNGAAKNYGSPFQS